MGEALVVFPESDVLEAGGDGAAPGGVFVCVGVFSYSQEEVKGNGAQMRDHFASLLFGECCCGEDVSDDVDWDC